MTMTSAKHAPVSTTRFIPVMTRILWRLLDRRPTRAAAQTHHLVALIEECHDAGGHGGSVHATGRIAFDRHPLADEFLHPPSLALGIGRAGPRGDVPGGDFAAGILDLDGHVGMRADEPERLDHALDLDGLGDVKERIERMMCQSRSGSRQQCNTECRRQETLHRCAPSLRSYDSSDEMYATSAT